MVLVDNAASSDEDILVHKQQSAINMTTYQNYPLPPKLREIAYPLDGQGRPVRPELLGLYSKDHDFSLPNCFHGRTVKAMVVHDYNGNGGDSVVLTCGISGEGRSKCGYILDVSQLLKQGNNLWYSQYRKRSDRSIDVPTNLPFVGFRQEIKDVHKAPDSGGSYMSDVADEVLLHETSTNRFRNEDDVDGRHDAMSITMASDVSSDNNDASVSVSESYEADVDSFLSFSDRQPLRPRKEISGRNIIIEDDVEEDILGTVASHLRTGDALCQWMKKIINDPTEAIDQFDDGDEGNKENLPPKESLTKGPFFKRRTRLVTSILRME